MTLPARGQRATSVLLLTGLLATLAMIVGCRSDQEIVQAGPLETDPTDEIDPSGWWSNGAALLHLNANGSYAYYDGPARLEPPTHRGRWTRLTHARLGLQPYTELESQTPDINIDRVNGEVHLRVPGQAAFRRLDEAPPREYRDVIERPMSFSNTA